MSTTDLLSTVDKLSSVLKNTLWIVLAIAGLLFSVKYGVPLLAVVAIAGWVLLLVVLVGLVVTELQ